MSILFLPTDQLGVLAPAVHRIQAQALKKKRVPQVRQVIQAMKSLGLIEKQAEVTLLGMATKSDGSQGLLIVLKDFPTAVIGQTGPEEKAE